MTSGNPTDEPSNTIPGPWLARNSQENRSQKPYETWDYFKSTGTCNDKLWSEMLKYASLAQKVAIRRALAAAMLPAFDAFKKQWIEDGGDINRAIGFNIKDVAPDTGLAPEDMPPLRSPEVIGRDYTTLQDFHHHFTDAREVLAQEASGARVDWGHNPQFDDKSARSWGVINTEGERRVIDGWRRIHEFRSVLLPLADDPKVAPCIIKLLTGLSMIDALSGDILMTPNSPTPPTRNSPA